MAPDPEAIFLSLGSLGVFDKVAVTESAAEA